MLDKICEEIIKKGYITTAELRELGITRAMIDKYLLSGELFRIKVGSYSTNSKILTQYADKKAKEANSVAVTYGNIKLTTVYCSLCNGQIMRAKRELEIYLNNLNKGEFLNLGLALIDYDVLRQDPAFYQFVIVFATLDVNQFRFDKCVFEAQRDNAIVNNEMRKANLLNYILELADQVEKETPKKMTLHI